eukprot:6181596-Pleurochrysis_carterae.AAC.5
MRPSCAFFSANELCVVSLPVVRCVRNHHAAWLSMTSTLFGANLRARNSRRRVSSSGSSSEWRSRCASAPSALEAVACEQRGIRTWEGRESVCAALSKFLLCVKLRSVRV